MGIPTRHRESFRWLLLALVLGGASGCKGPAARDPVRYYSAAEAEYRRGEYKSALLRARSGQADIGESRSPEWYWRFRLLEAETLISTGAAAEAVRILAPRAGFTLQVKELEPRRLLDLGWARSFLSEREASLALLDEARRLAASFGDREAMAQAELRRGTLLGYAKRFEESERAYLTSLELSRSLTDPYLEGSSLGSLGFLRLNLGRYEEATFFFDQVLPLARRIGSKSLEALTIQNLAWCYFRLGDFDKAAYRFEQAQKLFGGMGKLREHQISLGNLGSIAFSRGDYRAALSYYERALAAAKRIRHQASEADWLSNLALTLIELGEYGKAAAANNEARKLRTDAGDRQTDLRLRINEARIIENSGDTAKAEALYREVAASDVSQPMAKLDARSYLAELLARLGRSQDADREFRTVIEALENQGLGLSRQDWRITWQANLARFYKAYVTFLWNRGRREEALEAAESSRSRVLAGQLAGGRRTPPASARRMMALARNRRCTLLSYWLGKQASHLWIITGAEIESHVLPPQGEIASAVEAHRAAIERLRDPLRSELPAAERLSRDLLGPLRNREGCFVISPNQELHGLNFETLPVAGNRYWIEQAEISVVPSLALEADGGGAGRSNALLIGDPAGVDPVEYPPLANAGVELDAIAGLLAPAPVTLIRGAEATPGAYDRAGPGRFSLIHIASHATANRESPLDSAVILSREGERYSLSAREIARIPLAAKLVTISACRGAGEGAYAGEGTVGLAWGFLHAGARNVIAGLWAVDDVSTAKLMSGLYAAYAKGMRPSAALRAAKLDLIRSAASMRKPYYWAPFQVYRLP